MGRKAHKVEATHGGDMVIDLLVRHAAVPESGELLDAYSRIYSGRPVGHVVQVENPVEPVVAEPSPELVDDVVEPEIEVPSAEYESLEEVVAAAGDDSDNDYDAPGATVAMEAVDVPAEMMTFDAAEIDAVLPDMPSEPAVDVEAYVAPEEIPDAPVEIPEAPLEAVDAAEGEAEEEGEFDENATVMMGAVDESAGASQDDASNRKKKKRRHR